MHARPGEGLLAVSDGITETMSPARELFGTKRLMGTVCKSARTTCQEIVDSLVTVTRDFRGPLPQGDDVTVLALRWEA